MAEIQIKNLRELIGPILNEGDKYLEAKIYKLTVAGDNYGSLMLGVTISIEDSQGRIEHINVVAKLLPQNPVVQNLFNSQRTFRNEIGFYRTIAPCLRQFQKEQGFAELFDSFPAFYAARLNLNRASTIVDEDGALLIKNIKDDGFCNIDRTTGFDLKQTELILEKMAELHATTLAFKLIKPDVFEEKVGEFFEEFTVFAENEEIGNKMKDAIIESIKDDEFCAGHLKKIRDILDVCMAHGSKKNRKDLEGPFATLVHSDMWSNNIMVKIVDGETVDVKFVDFQIYEFASLTRDVVFFLFTSVQLPMIRKHCDDFLMFYYNSFLNYLKKFISDISVFTYEAFISEIKKVVNNFEFMHILLMLAPIYASEKDSKELDDLSMDDMIHQRKQISHKCAEKASFIVQEFTRRGWI